MAQLITTPFVLCPHCSHQYTDDEMRECEIDLLDIAIQEATAVLECPICDKEFFVKGGFQPQYTTAFAKELF